MHHGQHHGGGHLGSFLLGVLTTAAIGGYFLYGPRGKEHRKAVEHWMTKARAEILKRMEQAQDMTEEQYHRIVDEVTNRYGVLAEVGKEKASSAGTYFKRQWDKMREAARKGKQQAEDELQFERFE